MAEKTAPTATLAPPTDLITQLYIATCRANPNSADIHDYIPQPAGQCTFFRVERDISPDPAQMYTCSDTTGLRAIIPVDKLPDGDIVLVIHGFHETEAGGIAGAFRIAQALKSRDVPVFSAEAEPQPDALHVVGFTWPCAHSLISGYLMGKEAVARFASFSLVNLLFQLQGSPTPENAAAPPVATQRRRRVHIVAHSMGCFLTLKALNLIAILQPLEKRLPIVDEVIWLAPDIIADALECGVPDTTARFWRRRWQPIALKRLEHAFTPPRPLTPTQRAFVNAHMRGGHPLPAPYDQQTLDGYGYAALNAMRRLSIYSSLRDEAMWVSPIANMVTEESGGADGGVRLGLCGPLHPGLMMIPDKGYPRRVILNDCTRIISEHGDYFFHPLIHQDVANRIREAQADYPAPPAAGDPTTPDPAFPERHPLTHWHAGTPFVYPQEGEIRADGLAMYRINRGDGGDRLPNAPFRASTWTAPLYRRPLKPIGKLIIRFLKWHYHLNPKR